MVDLQDLTLIQLFRLLKLKSWLWVIGIGVGVFVAGLGFAAMIGVEAKPADIAKAEDALAEERQKVGSLQDENGKLTNDLVSTKQHASEAETSLELCLRESNDVRTSLTACQSKLSNAKPTLWLVHQGDGNGYPSGNNGIIANHDDKPDWDSTHYRSEACMQNGGPRIDGRYASRMCGAERAVGPFGVLDVNGGTCGHGMYVIACLGS